MLTKCIVLICVFCIVRDFCIDLLQRQSSLSLKLHFQSISLHGLQMKFLLNINILILALKHTVPVTFCKKQNKTPKPTEF